MNYIKHSIHIMNIQRITVSIPDYLYQQLIKIAQPRKISRFITQAIEKEIVEKNSARDPIDDFIVCMKKNKLVKKTRIDILKAIKKGRM
ncbi:MAG TPA: hypothetical protein VJB63_03735 [Patescibacteria group bacterium]|nr:hypothetical protein [Patescibacteria group bacterium]